MKIHSLHRTQNLPISLEEAWDFLSNPRNLKIITPDYMSFDILSGADTPMFPGQLIQYIVTPIAGIKTTWVTEITHVKEHEFFVDEQRFGPYSLWHHLHSLKTIKGGVEMQDLVHYKLPFGPLGELAHPFLVAPKLKEIFPYRRQNLETIFGKFSSLEKSNPDSAQIL